MLGIIIVKRPRTIIWMGRYIRNKLLLLYIVPDCVRSCLKMPLNTSCFSKDEVSWCLALNFFIPFFIIWPPTTVALFLAPGVSWSTFSSLSLRAPEMRLLCDVCICFPQCVSNPSRYSFLEFPSHLRNNLVYDHHWLDDVRAKITNSDDAITLGSVGFHVISAPHY